MHAKTSVVGEILTSDFGVSFNTPMANGNRSPFPSFDISTKSMLYTVRNYAWPLSTRLICSWASVGAISMTVANSSSSFNTF